MDKKDFSPIKSFLSGRVFIISLIILVLPLFFHAIFMYVEDYREKRTELFTSLESIQKIYLNNFQNKIKEQEKILQELVKEGPFIMNKITNYKFAFLLSYNTENKLSCVASANPEEMGKIFSKKLYYEAMEKKEAVFIDGTLFCLSRLVTIENGKEGLLVLSFSLDDFFYKDINLSYEFSVVNNARKIMYTTDDNWRGKYLSSEEQKNTILTTHDNKIKNAYFLHFQNDNYCAVLNKIKNVDFMLLISTLEEHLRALHMHSYFIHMMSLMGLAFLGLIIAGFLTFKMAVPLKNLYQVMQKIKNYDFSVRYERHSLGFEINTIGSTFNDMINSLVKHQKEEEKHLIERQRLISELRIGHQIQRSMFPSSVKKIEGLDVAYGYLPAREVGGDFYDLLPQGEENVFICVADAVGKGISACLYSLSMRSILRACVTTGYDLKKAIMMASELFFLDTKENSMFITAWLGIYNKKTNVLHYASCGHPPALLKRGEELIELKSDNIAFGVKDLIDAKIGEISLQKEDVLLAYSDGVIETMNVNNQLFGQEKLHLFLSKQDVVSSQDLVFKLLDEVKNFSKTVMQADDITVVVMKIP